MASNQIINKNAPFLLDLFKNKAISDKRRIISNASRSAISCLATLVRSVVIGRIPLDNIKRDMKKLEPFSNSLDNFAHNLPQIRRSGR